MPDAGVQAFLTASGWAGAMAAPLAGDASGRRYLRLADATGARAVVMIAPPAPDDSTARFCTVAEHLRAMGLSAPAVHHAAPDEGLALLEDFGDAVFAHVIARDPAQETPLYAAAIDLLVTLAQRPAPADLPAPDADTLARLTAPAAHWYLGHGTDAPDAAAQFAQTLAPALRKVMHGPPVLAHRDFHAENLIWLPDRAGAARVGLLDFQDAFAGPAGYDLVSLLEDARRDLPGDVRRAMMNRYATATGMPLPDLAHRLAVLGAQRNLRILGVFARLCVHAGKPRYVDLIPRVWGHLMGDLAHPSLADLRAAVTAHLPAPTPEILQTLRSRCKTPTTL